MASNPVFTFPADRAQRTTLLSGSSPAERLRFWTLTEHIAYPDVRNIVADYINSTISDPANTQRHRWTVEALTPSESDHERRLLTVTCGNLETLFVTEYSNEADDTIELEMTVNTAIPGGYTAQQLDISTDVVSATRGSYSSHEVWTWRIDLGALLTDDAEVDFGPGVGIGLYVFGFLGRQFPLNLSLHCGFDVGGRLTGTPRSRKYHYSS